MVKYKEPEPPPPYIPDATPSAILRKYVGTFRATDNTTVSITLTRNVLYITYPIGTFDPNITIIKTEKEDLAPTAPKTIVKPRPSISSLKTATASKKANATPTATKQPAIPTTPMTTKTSMVYLAVNGVPQIRVSGDTPEETEMNRELQAMGLLAPENKMVSFGVRKGKVRGVRVEGRMFERVKEKEKEKEKER
jgi:hypothetical protein